MAAIWPRDVDLLRNRVPRTSRPAALEFMRNAMLERDVTELCRLLDCRSMTDVVDRSRLVCRDHLWCLVGNSLGRESTVHV